MTDERKQELFPFYAFIKSKELNPEKYNQTNVQEWAAVFDKSPEDKKTIVDKALNDSDEEWNEIEKQYASLVGNGDMEDTPSVEVEEENKIDLAKKGAKLANLKKLQAFKKKAPVSKSKKCECGCDMIDKKEAGGVISTVCSCNCKGGKVNKELTDKVKSLNSKMKTKK